MSCCDNFNRASLQLRSTLIWAIALNATFIVAQVFYGLQSHSLALLADAGHNLGDLLVLGLAAVAAWINLAMPRKNFTYGLQSVTILAGLMNSLIMLFAFLKITDEAIDRLLLAAPAPDVWTMSVVAAVGIVIDVLTVFLLHRWQHHDISVQGMYLHLFTDVMVSFGVVIGGVLIGFTGWIWMDPLISLLIAGAILFNTWRMLRRITRLALQGVPTEVQSSRVAEFLRALPGVTDVHDLHIWALGMQSNAMSAHLLMPGGHPGNRFIAQTECELGQFGIGHATLQIEIGDNKNCQGCSGES